jgi:two-component system, OmpR family, response regulator ChvI
MAKDRVRVVALVEDEVRILERWSEELRKGGYQVKTFREAELAFKGLGEDPPDVLVLDLKLPDSRQEMDTYGFLDRLRAKWRDVSKRRVPVLAVSGVFTDVIHQATGNNPELVEDFMVKQAGDARLLVAKVKKLDELYNADEGEEKPIVTIRLRLDPLRRSCQWNDREVNLRGGQFPIMCALASGVIRSHEELFEAAGFETEKTNPTERQRAIAARIIDAIHDINKAFRRVDGSFDAIKTISGRGIRFADERHESYGSQTALPGTQLRLARPDRN